VEGFVEGFVEATQVHKPFVNGNLTYYVARPTHLRWSKLLLAMTLDTPHSSPCDLPFVPVFPFHAFRVEVYKLGMGAIGWFGRL
jgi:hypothetical protein